MAVEDFHQILIHQEATECRQIQIPALIMYGSRAANRRHLAAGLFLKATLWSSLIPSLFCFPLDIIHVAAVFPKRPRRNRFFSFTLPSPPPWWRRYHMRRLIMNRRKNNLCHIKLYCFRFAIFTRPSWSPTDAFCSHSEPPMALDGWQAYQNPPRLLLNEWPVGI